MKLPPLYPYQKRVSRFTNGKARVGLFIFYGSGKTYLSLKWLEQLHLAHKPIFPVLVLTMGSLVEQWGEEIKKHCDRKCILVTGNAQKRAKALESYAEIYVLNYDAIRSHNLLWILKHLHFNTVIADESTMLKEARTFRYKTWRKLLKDTPFRMLLAGKPIIERPEDIWAQMLFLDHGQTLGANFWKFRAEYFDPGPPWSPYKWTLKLGAGKKIATQLNVKCIQIKKKEIKSQLPRKIYVPVYFEMPTTTRKVYKELKDEFATTLASGEQVSTKWAMVRAAKMHQLCQGFIYTATGWEDVDQVKLNWLEENLPLMLSNGPVLLWVCFRAMQYRVAKLLGKMKLPFGCFRSKLSQSERTVVINGFNTEEFDILLLSQHTGAAGLNLQRANQAVFICTDFKAALRENAEERCHRIGSEIHESVTYYDLIIKRSMDEVVQNAIHRKLNVAEEILAYLQKGE